MGASRLVRHFRHRAARHLPGAPRPPGLETRLDLRPARFVVGAGERVHWSEMADEQGAPVCPAFYLGRVEEVMEDEVLVTVWERPSGREASVSLSVENQLEGRRPAPGSLLRLWTWLELPGGDERVPRLKVEVESPRLDEPERQRLRTLVETLKHEVTERGGHDA
jgi:hypothetical protein